MSTSIPFNNTTSIKYSFAATLFFLGMFYRSASLYHPQRRAILHIKDMSKKKGKDKNKIENKPPYFDFSTLRMKSLQGMLIFTLKQSCISSSITDTDTAFAVTTLRK